MGGVVPMPGRAAMSETFESSYVTEIPMTRHRSGTLQRALVATALFACTIGAAVAQQPVTTASSEAVSYLNGGFGQEEAARMREIAREFPIGLTFTRHDGTQNIDEFVADVNVRVRDSAGQMVLAAAGQGPIFLLRVPDGTYALEAEHNGEVKTRRIDVVGGRHQEIAFSWAG